MEMYIMKTDLFIDMIYECIRGGIYKKIKNYINGNIDKLKEGIVSLEFDKLIKLVEEKVKSSEVYVLADINGVPIFKTNLFLALEKIDDISALSTKVFLLGDGYLAQIVSRKTPLDIVALNSE